MSGKSNGYDKAPVESFFKSLKAELVWGRDWHTRRDVGNTIFEYITGFYHPGRKHRTPGWKSPLAFEQNAAWHEYLIEAGQTKVRNEGHDHVNENDRRLSRRDPR